MQSGGSRHCNMAARGSRHCNFTGQPGSQPAESQPDDQDKPAASQLRASQMTKTSQLTTVTGQKAESKAGKGKKGKGRGAASASQVSAQPEPTLGLAGSQAEPEPTLGLPASEAATGSQ